MSNPIKLAVFDVDGTLSAPQYRDIDGNPVIGFSLEEWIGYCKERGNSAYQFCKPIPGVLPFLQGLKKAGAVLEVVSTALSAEERMAKAVFVGENYPNCFEGYSFVDQDQYKVALIHTLARQHGCELSSCLFVDDSYPLLLEAHEQGIRAAHISNILAGNISG